MRLAFVTINSYDMLTGGYGGEVGGAELQQILLARALAERGHEVWFIERKTQETGDTDDVGGVHLHFIPDNESWGSVIRAGVRSVTVLQSLQRLDPDVIYVRTPKFDLLPAFTYTAMTDARLVYGFAHDTELTPNPVYFEGTPFDNWAYKRAVRAVFRRCDALVTQNEYQDREARRQFEVPIYHVPNGYHEPSSETASTALATSDRPTVLWVATLRSWKRPTDVLELAERFPNARFVVVGGRADESPEIYDEVEREATRRENVEFVGYVPYAEVDDYFAGADVFLNTSESEGFPNTFLQAWASRTLVASREVDPNGVVVANDLGVIGDGSLSTLGDRLEVVFSDSDYRERLSENAYHYYKAHHSIDAVAAQFESVLAAENVEPARDSR